MRRLKPGSAARHNPSTASYARNLPFSASRESLRIFRLQSVVLCAFLPPDWSKLAHRLACGFVTGPFIGRQCFSFRRWRILRQFIYFTRSSSLQVHCFKKKAHVRRLGRDQPLDTPALPISASEKLWHIESPTTSGHSVYPTVWQLSCLSGRVQIAILSSGLSRTR